MTSNANDMLLRRKKVLGPAYRLFYDNPVHLVRGEGVWLFDTAGRKYLDMYNNVPHVGHCHPRVVDAICKQVRTLNTHTRYLHDNVLDFAERLTAKFPEQLDTAMFSCTGTEANELALRIARSVTGGTGIIVTSFAYHGNSKAIYEISVSDIPADEIPDFVITVPTPDTYRGQYCGADAATQYAEHVREALAEMQNRGIKPAAFVIDTIVSSSGVVAPPAGYLGAVAEIIRGAGAMFIADEVQPGFGRTGKNFWGYELDDFVPDIVTMGKPMGNGHPIAAVVTQRQMIEKFCDTAHYFNTFGGNPVSCAAALAVLDVIEEENLQSNALQLGQYITDGLSQLAATYECIGDIRGSGLFLAVEFVEERESRTPATELTATLVNDLRERGVLTGSIGPDSNIMKLRPPMTLTTSDADFLLETLGESLHAITTD